jgi:phage regulator Rha-like protein
MSSREIAEIAGKQHKDVLESIRNMEPAWEKVNGRKFPLVEYTDAKGEKRPMYQLSKLECLYVATKFNDEARARLVVRWEQLEIERQQQRPLSQLEILQQSINMLVEQERRVDIIEDKLNKLDAKIATRPDYFTIVGYGTLHHVPVNLKQAASLGREESKLCKQRGIETDKIPDPRFGEVKTYPVDVLDEVFEQSLTVKKIPLSAIKVFTD